MSKSKRIRKQIKSKIEVIKKINEDPKKTADDLFDLYLDDLPSSQDFLGKKLDNFKEKRSKKKDNNESIFDGILDIANSFLSDKESKVKVKEGKPKHINEGSAKLKKMGLQAAKKTVPQIKKITLDSIKQTLFVGSDSICGVDSNLPYDTMTIKPGEFDFLNVLQVDPTTSLGIIAYEPESPVIGDVKMNRDLYSTFSAPYSFVSKSGNNLFDLEWDSNNQEYQVSGLHQSAPSIKIEEFLTDYYGSIEMPNSDAIIKNAMLLTLQGDGENPLLFDKGMNDLNRLCQKLFKICGSPEESGLIQTTASSFNENDEDIQRYFDFNDVEGIDLDDEDARYRKVLRFRDCGNFEIPLSAEGFEDFVYLSGNHNLNSAVSNAINNAAKDAFEQSEGSIPLENFQLSLMNAFILNLPKALVMAALSPKVFLPFVLVYKQLKGVALDIKRLMSLMWKLFSTIIKEIFWKFIQEFWKILKGELLSFVANLAKKILKKKYKRYVTIITALIALLTKILKTGIDNCYDLFNSIITAITAVLGAKGPALNVPGLLLSFSDLLPGYSTDRSVMNISERLAAAGIDVGPIYGDSNELVDLVKSIVEGNSEEIDQNSYVVSASKFTVIPTPMGPVPLPPGYISMTGKLF
jgi:hypothetical protein